MAQPESLISCLKLASAKEILNAVLVQASDNTVGLRTVQIEDANPTYLAACAVANYDLDDILRRIVVLDAAGKPALNLVKDP